MSVAFSLGNSGIFAMLGGLLFLLGGDMFSAAGGLALAGKIRDMDKAAASVPAEIAAESAGEDGGT
jgi:hypothetical protein